MKDIFYFMLGTMVGAVFALLFAPQTGEELRSNIQATAEKDWQKLQEQLQAEMQKINARLDELTTKSEQEALPAEEAVTTES
jgi:gas vesicle protein